jgi:hypothetical protein
MHYKGNYYSSNQEICVTAQLYMPHCLEWLWTLKVTPYREALELGRWCLPQFPAVFRIPNLCLQIRQLQLLVYKHLIVFDCCLCLLPACILISIQGND